MIYHIFGSTNGPNIKCKLKDDLAYNCENYEQCLDDYNRIIEKGKYSDVYFVCDFGNYKPNFLEYVPYVDDKPYLPFMIISEWHIDQDLYSGDKISDSCLALKGFKEFFTNNRIALEKFLYYIQSKIQAEFYYGKNNSIYLTDTREIMFSKAPYMITRFKFGK